MTTLVTPALPCLGLTSRKTMRTIEIPLHLAQPALLECQKPGHENRRTELSALWPTSMCIEGGETASGRVYTGSSVPRP
eukprot:1699520-Amphidinium_carterae.1